MSKVVKLGGASGYWGESDMAWAQLLNAAPDYLIFDYLAEITMSLMATMRARNPDAGFAPDFVSGLAAHLPQIAAKRVKIIANAGGVNPEGCAAAVRAVVAQSGLDLRVCVVTGDDLMDRRQVLSGAPDMFSGAPGPDPNDVLSANAYLGAFPIAQALNNGADIVITGRCVDSALTLGPLIHEFGWGVDELDRLAQGSLVGHLIECGPQVTGGNFTDWMSVADSLVDIGYPIAEVNSDGSCIITKPSGTGGNVSRGTVSEQMLYEIGDPENYILPDVICDFTVVKIREVGPNRVHVSGARGRGVPTHYKVCTTVTDGYRINILFFMIGRAAVQKAHIFYDAAVARTRRALDAKGWDDFATITLETLGNDSHFGAQDESDEIAFRISARHADAKACTQLLKAASGLGLACPPGLVIYSGARPKPQAVARLHTTLIDRTAVQIKIDDAVFNQPVHDHPPRPRVGSVRVPTPVSDLRPPNTGVPLEQLAWLRSGDKGDICNIGVAARHPDLMPYIWAALSVEAIQSHFSHFVDGNIQRWYLPGSYSMNILMNRALGGGGMASLRNDPQGKSFAQVLARLRVSVPTDLLPPTSQSAM